MCRHLGWLGADVTVSSLVLDPPNGLRVQSYAPRRQKYGLMNADGWGVGFFDGHWLLSHNGVVDRSVLPSTASAESVCDSAILAAAIFARGLDALGDTIAEIGTADPIARLNILAANGSRLLATVWGDTLFILRRDDGVVLASEPYDDDFDWEDVPDRHLVEVTAEGVTLTSLAPSGPSKGSR